MQDHDKMPFILLITFHALAPKMFWSGKTQCLEKLNDIYFSDWIKAAKKKEKLNLHVDDLISSFFVI